MAKHLKSNYLMRFCIIIAVSFFAQSCKGPQPIASRNIAYGSHSQTLDLWIPAAEHKDAALLFIHGGGFKDGDKEQMQGYCELYAKGGFISGTINYRLTSQGYSFPAPLEDAKEAVAWMRSKAATYGYDPGKIVLIGYSAGGNLALMAGFDLPSEVAAIVSVAGPTDLRSLVDGTAMDQLKTDIANYIGSGSYDAVSPLFAASADAPPTLFMHGADDSFVPIAQSSSLSQKLGGLGAKTLMKEYPGVGHEIFLSSNPRLKDVLDTLTSYVAAVDQE